MTTFSREQVMLSVTQDALQAVMAVAQKAGEAIMSVYQDQQRYNTQTKPDNSPVTDADVLANQVILQGLRELPFPTLAALPVISEELDEGLFENRRDWPACWLVDPLDGTKEFLARNGEFSVNIALVVGHEVYMGVVHGPAAGVSYVAARGLGAYRVAGHGWDVLVTARMPARDARRPVRITLSRRHHIDRVERLAQVVKARWGEVEMVHAGSAFKLCAVAEGSADVYPRFGPTYEWDTAAAQVIVEEAGGHVLTMDGQRLRYNARDTLLNGNFLACGSVPASWLGCLAGLV